MNVFVPVVYHRRNNWPICVLYFAFSLFDSITTTISISTMCIWLHNRERHSRRRKLHLFPRLYISTGSQSLRQQDLLFKVRSSLPWLLSRFFLSFFLFKTKINRQQRQTRKRSLTLSLSLSLVTKVIEALYNHKHHEDLEKSKFTKFWGFFLFFKKRKLTASVVNVYFL